jgi:hypothetical protein
MERLPQRFCLPSELGNPQRTRVPTFPQRRRLRLTNFAPRNATVITALFVAGGAVSGAIFLILEMYAPFGGLIKLSSAPLRTALTHLGQ